MIKLTYFISVLLLITVGGFGIDGCNQEPEFSGATVAVAVNETGAPIQKYIYGQFIEHLGRCIYGGIWAEMLMDRKFYYPVTDEYSPWAMASESFWADESILEYPYLARSPWQIVGSPGNLVMDRGDPYVGEHTPVIKVNGQKAGIQQNELSVLAGQNYVGRVILAGERSLLPVSIQLSTSDEQTETITIENISSEFQTYPFEFTPGFTSDSMSLGIFSEGIGSLRIGTVSLMPADNIQGWRQDVVGLLK